MQNVVMIHGYNGIPKIYYWLKQELETRGYLVIIPEFPAQEGVVYDKWIKILDEYKPEFNSETIVIAHSIGNEFIIKYLVENNIDIGLYISLAGFCECFEWIDRPDLNRAVKEFLVSKEEIEEFKKLAKEKYSIYSDNDHIVPFEVLENYPQMIDSESILIRGIGHMGKKSGLETIPEVLEIIEGI